MTYLHVGMNQGAVLPMTCVSYQGLSTHGIDSCTGVAIRSKQHVFLSHMPPPPLAEKWDEMLAWRERYKKLIDEALSRMDGEVVSASIVSPNREEEMPNGGPTLISGTLNILYGIKTMRELGNAVKIDIASGSIAASYGGLKNTEYTEMPGGSDAVWVLIN